tara:strand:+ start:1141 stop:1536 length:396 start_codon:yes stop_codon:yes gene_type:complete
MKKAAIQKLNNDSLLVTDESKAKRPPFKLEETLLCFFKFGTAGVIQPQAHNEYRESCLHTTVSELQNKHGIHIFRKPDEPYSKYRRPFTRYWFADNEQARKAVNLINYFRAKRGLTPLLDLPAYPFQNMAA